MTQLINGNFDLDLDPADEIAPWKVWVLRGSPKWNLERLSPGADPRTVSSGDASLRIGANWQTWHAGISQQVQAGRDSVLDLTAVARRWGTNDNWEDSMGLSNPDLASRFWVGIDPAGGTDPASSGIVAVSRDLTDDFRSATVRAVALADIVTCFVGLELGVNDMWPYTNMFGFVDAVALMVTPPGTPEPLPVPVPAGLTMTIDGNRVIFEQK